MLRLSPDTTSKAFEHYLRVRDQVRGLRELEAHRDDWTPSERSMISALAWLWDAAPESIATLRHRADAVSGVRAADYHQASPLTRMRLERELARLLEEGDRTLWVDEPQALGGFGFRSGGLLYNEDTLRSFRVISLLQDAALLSELRDARSRRTVWEIGGGWGGFAHHFKTLCPNVTYLITGTPNLFLLSAVYLMTLFPAASFRFFETARPDAFWQDWDAVDFAFAPEFIVAGMQPAAVHLTVDVATLERMNETRIALHVGRAHELECRYFFSVCPSQDPDPAVASPVRPIVERRYWPHPVSAPAYLAKRLAVRAGNQRPFRRTYFLGWRRLHV